MSSQPRRPRAGHLCRPALIALVVLLAATCVQHAIHWSRGVEPLVGHDLYSIWSEGRRITDGINPYQRILGHSLLINKDYPTYLPLSYLFAALVNVLGLHRFDQFLLVWRPLTLLCHLGIGVLVFRSFALQGKVLGGLAATAVLLLGRWSNYVVAVHHVEFAAILPLLLSLQQLERRPRQAGLLLGLSLAIKQVAILILPLHLILLARSSSAASRTGSSGGRMLGFLLAAAALPVLLSLPFVLNSPLGFLQSMAFSGTRLGMTFANAGDAPIALLGLTGVRLVMVALIALVLVSAAREQLNRWAAAALITLLFTQFNPVLFTQYYEWFLALVLLSMAHTGKDLPQDPS